MRNRLREILTAASRQSRSEMGISMKNRMIIKVMLVVGIMMGFTSGCTQKTTQPQSVNITETAEQNSTQQQEEILYDDNGNQYHYIKTEGYEVKEICNDRQFQEEKALYDGKSIQTDVYSIANSFGENKYQVTYLSMQKLFMEEENVKEISYTVENIPGALYAKGEDEKLPTSYREIIYDENTAVKLLPESTETLYLRLYSETKSQSALEEQQLLIEALEKVIISADITYEDGTTVTKYAKIKSSSAYSVGYLIFYEI